MIKAILESELYELAGEHPSEISQECFIISIEITKSQKKRKKKKELLIL